MRRVFPLLLITGLFAGCSSSGGDDDSPSDTEATPTPTAAVTWYGDIQPVMQRACMRCHNADGQAPHDFTQFENVKPYAPLIANYVRDGVMPPPAADPACRDYNGSEARFVTEEEKALFQTWNELGAPMGDAAQAPPPAVFDHTLHDANLEYRIAEPYKPQFDASGNAYTCFVISPNRDASIFINGMGALVDKNEVVHHMVLYLDMDGDISGKFGSSPFDCMDEHDNPELDEVTQDWAMLSAWGPGGPTVEFDEGLGMEIAPESALILQMHYFESGPDAAETADQSGISIRTTDQIEREVYYAALGPTDFVIPAGDPAYTSTETLPLISTPDFQFDSLEIIGVFPHMHVLGNRYHNWVSRRGEETCMVQSDAYDFHNQETYMFREPVVVRSGDVLSFQCTWNNSTSNPNLIYDPPIDITYGEGTDDEMCFFLTFFVINE